MEAKKVVLVATLANNITLEENADYVGIDRGALVLARANIHMKCAIGDFDSVNVLELDLIKNFCDELIMLDPIKDETDTEYALKYISDKGYKKIELYGGMHGRADHYLVNLMLVYKSDLPLVLCDENNRIRKLSEGIHTINKSKYKYLSFIAFKDVMLSLEGVYYPLDHQLIKLGDVYTISNEITSDYATISVYNGDILLLECKDEENAYE